jgi:hypothetical protein
LAAESVNTTPARLLKSAAPQTAIEAAIMTNEWLDDLPRDDPGRQRLVATLRQAGRALVEMARQLDREARAPASAPVSAPVSDADLALYAEACAPEGAFCVDDRAFGHSIDYSIDDMRRGFPDSSRAAARR